VEPVSVVRNLGVWIDSELTLRDHISRTFQSCFIICAVSSQSANFVCAFVLSRLDYCNSVLAVLPASTLTLLQRVLHAADRLVNDLKASDHVTSTLVDLHWLPIKQRVDYKLCCHVHDVSIGHAPAYVSDMLTACADVPSISRLRTSSSGDYVIPRTRLKLGERAFAVSAPSHGTRFRMNSRKLNALQLSNVSLKHFYSNQRIFSNRLCKCVSGLLVGGTLNRIMLCYVMLCHLQPTGFKISVLHGTKVCVLCGTDHNPCIVIYYL